MDDFLSPDTGQVGGQDGGDSAVADDEDEDESYISPKTFKERAAELEKKLTGPHSHLVERNLKPMDWLRIHRIIRKSKGLKSKFMIKNLNPILFDASHVSSWQCKMCKEKISSPEHNYMSHFMSHGHNADDEALYPCDVCGLYVKKDKYVVHWVPHFMEHKCPKCNKTFALNCHMKYHYKVVHEEGEQTCYQCGRLLKNDLAMRRHLRLFHSNRTNWKTCDICGKRVKSRCLEPHKLTHSQDRPYKCDVCRKCFKTPSTLYQHQKVHANDSKAHKYLCEYCGKRFKHHTSWNLHVVRIHEGEYEHECPVCHKRFHKLFELKKHSVKHSEDRPFPCSVCNKHFKTKTHLKEHITIHSNEKTHLCPLCGKGIRMKANLYKHLKVHRNRGEYVPPLHGTTTNFLVNNYGYSPALCSSFSSSRKSSTRDLTIANGTRSSSPSSSPEKKKLAMEATSVATITAVTPIVAAATTTTPAPLSLPPNHDSILRAKEPELSIVPSSSQALPLPPASISQRISLSAPSLLSTACASGESREGGTGADEATVKYGDSSTRLPCQLSCSPNLPPPSKNSQAWHCRRNFSKLTSTSGIVLNRDGTVIHPITHIIPVSTSPSSQIEISRTKASENAFYSTNKSTFTNANSIHGSNNVISLIASQSGNVNTTGDTITHVTIMVGQLNNPYPSTDLQPLTTNDFSP